MGRQEFLNFFDKVPQCRKNCRTVPKMSHSFSLYIDTNYRMLLPILIHWLGFRLSTPYLDTLNRLGTQTESNTRVVTQSESSTEKNPSTSSAKQNQVLRNPSRQPITIEHGKNPSTSSANQKRVSRNSSRQQVRIEIYVTWELSARVEDPTRLSAVGSSRLAIAYLNTQGLQPPQADHLSLLLLLTEYQVLNFLYVAILFCSEIKPEMFHLGPNQKILT